jgi:leader peptidase (prepilin peptidase)/N-methyltransferase
LPTLSELPYALVAGTAVALGLAFGSFLNVVIHRMPRGESVVRPTSRCPSCGAPIRAWQNVPVLSWVLLRGRARCCNAPIPFRYALVELLGGLLAWALVETVVASLPGETAWWHALGVFTVYLALGLGLLAAAFIDLEHMYLPDELTIGGTVLGLASVPLRPGAAFDDALIGAAAGFLVIWLPFDFGYRKLRGQPGMGLGDAKLVMLAGAWFGWQGALFTLLAGAVQGTLAALAVLIARGRIDEPEAVRREREELQAALEAAQGEERAELERELAQDPLAAAPEQGLGKARLAFGPFLVLAALEYLLFGKLLVDEYLLWT